MEDRVEIEEFLSRSGVTFISLICVIYRIKTLERSMVSFFLILESLNEIWGHLSEFENSVLYGVFTYINQVNVKLLISIQTLIFQFSHSPALLALRLGYLCMAPRLSVQNCKVFKFLSALNFSALCWRHYQKQISVIQFRYDTSLGFKKESTKYSSNKWTKTFYRDYLPYLHCIENFLRLF